MTEQSNIQNTPLIQNDMGEWVDAAASFRQQNPQSQSGNRQVEPFQPAGPDTPGFWHSMAQGFGVPTSKEEYLNGVLNNTSMGAYGVSQGLANAKSIPDALQAVTPLPVAQAAQQFGEENYRGFAGTLTPLIAMLAAGRAFKGKVSELNSPKSPEFNSPMAHPIGEPVFAENAGGTGAVMGGVKALLNPANWFSGGGMAGKIATGAVRGMANKGRPIGYNMPESGPMGPPAPPVLAADTLAATDPAGLPSIPGAAVKSPRPATPVAPPVKPTLSLASAPPTEAPLGGKPANGPPAIQPSANAHQQPFNTLPESIQKLHDGSVATGEPAGPIPPKFKSHGIRKPEAGEPPYSGAEPKGLETVDTPPTTFTEEFVREMDAQPGSVLAFNKKTGQTTVVDSITPDGKAAWVVDKGPNGVYRQRPLPIRQGSATLNDFFDSAPVKGAKKPPSGGGGKQSPKDSPQSPDIDYTDEHNAEIKAQARTPQWEAFVQRTREHPKGWKPVVVDITKELEGNKLRPEQMALIRDSVERFVAEYPNAARTLSRIEVVNDSSMRSPDVRGVYHAASQQPAFIGGSEGGLVTLNIDALNRKFMLEGPKAYDATLWHEALHASQDYMNKPAFRPSDWEDSAHRLSHSIIGHQPEAYEYRPPLSPFEVKHGADAWRLFSKQQNIDYGHSPFQVPSPAELDRLPPGSHTVKSTKFPSKIKYRDDGF